MSIRRVNRPVTTMCSRDSTRRARTTSRSDWAKVMSNNLYVNGFHTREIQMKCFSRIASGLLIIAFALSGCALQPYDPAWITLIDGEKGLENFERQGEANWRAEDG